jgi:hypothetical protein
MNIDNIDQLPISPNPGQQNMDKVSNTLNERVRANMGVLPDTDPSGRPFLRGEDSLFGYNGVVVRNGEIVSLINLGGNEEVPNINLDTEICIIGDKRGYVSSGHKPGDKVKVIRFIEPFFEDGGGSKSSDKIIQVEGGGVIGWIKPSEVDKNALKEQREQELRKLFEKST